MTAPAPYCTAHPGGTFEACEDCAKARGERWAWIAEHGDDAVAQHNGSPSVGGPGVPAPVLASGPIAGGASGAQSPSAPDAFPTTRASRLVLAVDVVPLHDFAMPGAPVTGYRARMQGEHISPRWIGDPHRTRAAAERDVHELIGAAS